MSAPHPSQPRPVDDDEVAAAFIDKWGKSGAAERANFQPFLTELCDLLDVPRPDPTRPDDRDNAYVFERTVTFHDGDEPGGADSTGRIDLYKRGCFVMEAKQGSAARDDADAELFAPAAPARHRRGTAVRDTKGWDVAMAKAKGQAERYVRALPPAEGNPPFVVVVDVGHTFGLYADFSRLGKTYAPFPDAQGYRVKLADLADARVRARLAKLWTDPLSLDPTRHSAVVTRDVAAKLGALAKSLESSGHHAESFAGFLMRCLFTFFAEDAGLIERQRPDEQPSTQLLAECRDRPEQFVPMVQDVCANMGRGGFAPALRRRLKRFNGKLFKETEALPRRFCGVWPRLTPSGRRRNAPGWCAGCTRTSRTPPVPRPRSRRR